ncbi:PREDICTED: uncharacterized protein LOC104810361 isoform X2 [Tarenaya hassleriana]|uniref:uncharacterized protein LOC104810361 isoform X2 n=1 Tax=Tarenaya hassleriana TaxID=28532 RepID=UPI00053C87F4|nr:PREDICTED: uncharacterized protein LOC104810361 isoform X2 [Tarenaya hassleriana]
MEGENRHEVRGEPEWLRNYLDRQGDWLEKTKANLVVAATIIASMSFQMMVNPPGGVWQEDKCNVGGGGVDWAGLPPVSQLDPVCTKIAGTSVLEHSDSKRVGYIGAVISCTVSFSASMSIILLAISGLRLRSTFSLDASSWEFLVSSLKPSSKASCVV